MLWYSKESDIIFSLNYTDFNDFWWFLLIFYRFSLIIDFIDFLWISYMFDFYLFFHWLFIIFGDFYLFLLIFIDSIDFYIYLSISIAFYWFWDFWNIIYFLIILIFRIFDFVWKFHIFENSDIFQIFENFRYFQILKKKHFFLKKNGIKKKFLILTEKNILEQVFNLFFFSTPSWSNLHFSIFDFQNKYIIYSSFRDIFSWQRHTHIHPTFSTYSELGTLQAPSKIKYIITKLLITKVVELQCYKNTK